MITALFLPLLLWTGSVVVISLMGYPEVICMTPVAWVLALPVGLRVHRESQSPRRRAVLEAALSGGFLGFWQGLMVPAVMVSAAYVAPGRIGAETPSPVFAALLMVLLSVPVTAGIAALVTAWMRRQDSKPE